MSVAAGTLGIDGCLWEVDVKTQLKVRRWQKHGHDRLYIETTSGIKVGWFDLRTQRHHLDQPGMWPEFQQAIAEWRNLPKGTPHHRRNAPAERDLAANQAGAALQARADKLQPESRAVRGLAKLFRVKTADYSWRTGAVGERVVGSKLEPLIERGWHVIHGLELGAGGDIDHLVIGPMGIFTVNTKHHPRAMVKVGEKVIFVRGRQQPYVGKAGREAIRARIALSEALGRQVHVAPLIVVHGHLSMTGWLKNRPQGVQVLPSWAVRGWCRLPGKPVLDAAAIAEVYAAARRSSTWKTV